MIQLSFLRGRSTVLLGALVLSGFIANAAPAEQSKQSAAIATVPSVDVAGALEVIAHGGLLVDVREPAELAESGKLKGALNVPLSAIKHHFAGGRLPPELAAHPDRPVVFYCRSGTRAAAAAAMAQRNGLSQVHNLGGFENAVRAGFPVER